MKEYSFLRFLDKFKNIYTKCGVDYEKMRLILSVKLTLDSRKTSTVMQNSSSSKDKETKSSFTKSLIMYAIMGAFIGMATLTSFNKMYTYSIVFGMFMFFILTIFISDFSNVLLDVRDKNIIGTKGIDNKTINAAKLTHICYYIFLISLSLSYLAIIGTFKYGILTGILFIIELIVTDIFMVVITALIYLTILKFFDGEKVKDIINFVQIALTIIMAISYQFLGRMFNMFDLDIIYESSIWNIFLPPMWFAAPLYTLSGGKTNNIIIVLICLAFAIPILSIILYLKNTSKFEDYLSKLMIAKSNEKEKNKGILYKLGKFMCNNAEQKSFYDLSFSIMKREREFKTMAYPNLGFLIVFPFIFIFLSMERGNYGLSNLPLDASLNIYWFIFMIPSIMLSLQYSKNYKAAWIYESAYISNYSNVYKGAYKALLFNLILPLYLVLCVIFILLFGIKVIPTLIITFICILIFMVIGHRVGKFSLPFTVQAGVIDKSRNLLTVFLGLIINIIAYIINSILLDYVYALIAYGLVLAVVAYILWKKMIKVYYN